MTPAISATRDFKQLRADLSAPLILPHERGWDGARQAWNLAVDQRPVAVAYASGADDVVAVVQFAREHGLRVAAQGTGHGAATLELEDTILLKTLRMNSVQIDATEQYVRVEPGALWGEVAVRAGAHGLAGLAGTAADVGVVGYTLGGGLGWLGRRYGLACNSVRAVELVTADGELVRTDREHEPDLFWALRGGGGGFGIVTALELGLYPVSDVFAGMLVWPAACSEAVLERYRDWTHTVPETLSSIFRLLNAPPLPSLPAPIRGKSLVTIDLAYLGTEADGNALVLPLRDCAEPLIDSFGMIPASQLTQVHGEPDAPSAGIGDGCLIADLDAGAADAILALQGPGSASPLLALELRHLGGALGTPAPDDGALASLNGSFAMFGIGKPIDDEHAAAINAHLDALTEAMRPYECVPRSYLNLAARRPDPAGAFEPETLRRLRMVKATYDPHELLRSNQPISPLGRAGENGHGGRS